MCFVVDLGVVSKRRMTETDLQDRYQLHLGGRCGLCCGRSCPL